MVAMFSGGNQVTEVSKITLPPLTYSGRKWKVKGGRE